MRRLALAVSICLAGAATQPADAVASPTARNVDPARLKSAGIRILEGRYLILYTDVPSSPEVDRLPTLFDQAVPLWADYFGVDSAKLTGWRAQGFLIGDRRRFDALGLMPAGNDSFVNGISLGSELWLYDQPTDYYRRHLLLHEGTHVFMTAFLGGCGPGWYMEGTAELLGTHRFDDQTVDLQLRIMPRDRRDVPMLGRIKLIRDAVAQNRALPFPAVLQFDNRQQLGNEAYAWCWAAAKWLDSHPKYRERFQQLKDHVLDPRFNERLERIFADDWADLCAEWQAYVATLDHGYDFERTAIQFDVPRLPASDTPVEVSVAADRGWQSTGALLEKGQSYRITATGRYEIAREVRDGASTAWPCEPGGVTVEYHDGRPLGMLLGAIDGRRAGATLADTFGIGASTIVTPKESGTLFVRVNDSIARLDDNRGAIAVKIEPHQP